MNVVAVVAVVVAVVCKSSLEGEGCDHSFYPSNHVFPIHSDEINQSSIMSRYTKEEG